MFCHFWQKFKMAAIFWEGKIFLKLPRVQCSDTLWVENFDKIALSYTVKEIEANLCFAIFWQKFENSKWPPFFEEGKIFWKLQRVHCLGTLWVENFDEIALCHAAKEKEANSCFAIFGKNSKWPPFLGRGKFTMSTMLRYPVGRKFRRNRSISHG